LLILFFEHRDTLVKAGMFFYQLVLCSHLILKSLHSSRHRFPYRDRRSLGFDQLSLLCDGQIFYPTALGNTCFFCAGVSSIGKNEEEYKRITSI